MTTTGQDTLGTRDHMTVGGETVAYYSLAKAADKLGDISRLPFTLKVLLENMLRFEDGTSVTTADAQAVVDWLKDARSNAEIQYRPARVLLQDFTGVPCVVDLAAMRDAMNALGGDAQKINPQVPVHLVIDHSVMVDEFGTPQAFEHNVEMEYRRNMERYEFLKWGSKALDNFYAVPPGTGICHQVNLENIARGVWASEGRGRCDGGLSRHLRRHRQPHDDDQRAGRARLGRGRDRGRGRDARPAGIDADPRSGGLQADRRAGRGHHRHRPGADGDADAAPEGRGRAVRGVLRSRRRLAVARRPRDARQHVARIWRHLRLFPDRRERRSSICA